MLRYKCTVILIRLDMVGWHICGANWRGNAGVAIYSYGKDIHHQKTGTGEEEPSIRANEAITVTTTVQTDACYLSRQCDPYSYLIFICESLECYTAAIPRFALTLSLCETSRLVQHFSYS